MLLMTADFFFLNIVYMQRERKRKKERRKEGGREGGRRRGRREKEERKKERRSGDVKDREIRDFNRLQKKLNKPTIGFPALDLN